MTHTTTRHSRQSWQRALLAGASVMSLAAAGVLAPEALLAQVVNNPLGALFENFAPTTYVGNVQMNVGTIQNDHGAIWVGDVLPTANTAPGEIINAGGWIGAIDQGANTAGAAITNTAAGQWVGAVFNDGGTLDNQGVMGGGLVTNDSGQTTNEGAMIAGAAVSGGTLQNNSTGAITQGVSVTGGSLLNAGGLIAGGASLSGTGLLTNAPGGMLGGAVSLSGSSQLDNQAQINGAVSNTGTAVLDNSGLITGTVANSSTGGPPAFTNLATGEVGGLVTNTAGETDNYGVFDSGAAVSQGLLHNEAGGSIANGVSVSAGEVANAGTVTGNVQTSGNGFFYNAAGGKVLGSVSVSVTGASGLDNYALIQGSVTNSSTPIGVSVLNEAPGEITGLVTNNAGEMDNYGRFDAGAVVNAGLLVDGKGSAIAGGVTVNGGEADNHGSVTGGVTVTGSGVFDNGASGQIGGPVKITGSGELLNSGAITGPLTLLQFASFTNNGVYSGQVNIGALAAFTNNDVVTGGVDNSGTFVTGAGSTVSGLVVNQQGSTDNYGALNGGLDVIGGLVTNEASGAIHNGLSLSAGEVDNFGLISNDPTVTGGSLINYASGTISGLLVVTGGSVQNFGAVTSGADLSGGQIINQGGATLAGGLTMNGGQADNFGALSGGLQIAGGAANNYGQITGGATVSSGVLTNFSTGSIGGGLKTNGGTTDNFGVVAGTVNISLGSVNNEAGGQIQGPVNNYGSGFLYNDGLITGAVTNTSAYGPSAVLNDGLGVIDGQVSSSVGRIDNYGQMIGGVSLTNTAALFNQGGATLAGGVQTAGLSFLYNAGTISGAVTNASTFAPAGFVNDVGGQVTGLAGNTAGVTLNFGLFNGGASVSGGLLVNEALTGVINNTLTVSGGEVDNHNIITGGANVSGGLVVNEAGASLTGPVAVSGGTLGNVQGATVTGNVAITLTGYVYNNGLISGTVSNGANPGLVGFVNDGAGVVTGLVTNTSGEADNLGLFENGAAVTGGLLVNRVSGIIDNALNLGGGEADNYGTVNGGAGVTSGLLVNETAAIVNGGLSVSGGAASNAGFIYSGVSVSGAGLLQNQAGGVINAAPGATTGLTVTGGEAQNWGVINGGAALSGGQSFNYQYATLNGAVVNSGTSYLYNAGQIVGAVTNSAGAAPATLGFRNDTTGVVTSLVTNTAGVTLNYGLFSGGALVSGGLLVNEDPPAVFGVINNGLTVTGGEAVNYGIVNSGASVSATGLLINEFDGVINAAPGAQVGLVQTAGETDNFGQINGGANLSGGRSYNDYGAVINGVVNNSGASYIYNNGLINGALNNSAASPVANVVNDSHGVVQGLVTNTAGEIDNYGLLNGGANVSGGYLYNYNPGPAGVINGGVVLSNGYVGNSGVINGAGADGADLSGGQLVNTTSGVINAGVSGGSATLAVSLTAGELDNYGQINGAVVNAGTGYVYNNGAINGPLTNSAVDPLWSVVNDASGVVQGLVTNTAGAIVNGGIFNDGVNVSGGEIVNFNLINGGANDGGDVSGGTLLNNGAINAGASGGAPTLALNITGGAVGNYGQVNGNVVNSISGYLYNDGAITGTVTNSSTFAPAAFVNDISGTVSGLVTNTAGWTENRGAFNGAALVTGGGLNNDVPGVINQGLTVTGGLAYNFSVINGEANTGVSESGGLVVNEASGVVNAGPSGLALAITGGETDNLGLINGNVTNAGTGYFYNDAAVAGTVTNSSLFAPIGFYNDAAGAVSGLVTNTDGVTDNFGAFNGAALVSGGQLVNDSRPGAVGVINQGLTVTGGVADNLGVINGQGNDGADVSGGLLVNHAGGVINAGVSGGAPTFALNASGGTSENYGLINGAVTLSGGAYVYNDATILGTVSNNDAAGDLGFYNDVPGSVSGLVTTNSGVSENFGTFHGGALVTGGALTNETTGVIHHGLTTTGGQTWNYGQVHGGAAISGGFVYNEAGGVIHGGVGIGPSGYLYNDGVVWGGLTNGSTYGLPGGPSLYNDTGGVIHGLVTTTAGLSVNLGLFNDGALLNGGEVDNSGVINSGAVVNAAAALLVNEAGGVINAAPGAMVGLTVNAGEADNFGSVYGGALVTGGLLVNEDPIGTIGTIYGGLTVTGGEADNFGLVLGGAAVSGGLLVNEAPAGAIGVIDGGLSVSGGLAVNYGTVNGGAILTGPAPGGRLVNEASGVINDGLTVGAGLAQNAGVVNDGAVVTGGELDNLAGGVINATPSAPVGLLVLGGVADNFGTINGGASVAGGFLLNDYAPGAVGVINGGLLVSGGQADNAGTVNGGATVAGAGLLINLAATGLISGGLTVTGGEADNYATVNGGATVTGGALFNSLTGVINGGLANGGTGLTINNGQIFGGAVITGGEVENLPNGGPAVITGAVSISATGYLYNGGQIVGPVTNATNPGLVGFDNLASGSVSGLVTNASGVTWNYGLFNAGASITGGELDNWFGGLINGAVSVTQGGYLYNNGRIAGAVTNNLGVWAVGVYNDVSGVVTGLVTNDAGVTLNYGLFKGGLQLNGGEVDNYGQSVGGQMVQNGLLINESGGVLNGGLNMTGGETANYGVLELFADNTASGYLYNDGVISGPVGNANTAGVGFYNASGGTVNGTVTNSLGLTDNWGVINGAAQVSGGEIANELNASLTGAVLVNGTGYLYNDGRIGGAVTVDSGPVVITETMRLAAISSAASFYNDTSGVVVGGLVNQAGVTLNFGLIETGAAISGGSVYNEGDPGVIDGPVTISGTGYLYNAGQINGTVSNAVSSGSAVGFYNAAGGVVSGLVTNASGVTDNYGLFQGGANVTGGVLNTLGTVLGGLTNAAVTNAQGVIQGAIVNAGAFTVTGPLAENGSPFTNQSGGLLYVGNQSFTGVGALSNAGGATVVVGVGEGSGAFTVGSLSNAGTVTLHGDGVVGDTVTVTGAYVGSGAAVLAVDARLGGPGSTADTLTAASTSGSTRLAVYDTIPAAAGVYNPGGILVVNAQGGAASVANFTLVNGANGQAGPIYKGLFQYDLAFNAANAQFLLVSVPTVEAFQLSTLSTQARDIWFNGAADFDGRQAERRDALLGTSGSAANVRGQGWSVWASVTGDWTVRRQTQAFSLLSQSYVNNTGYHTNDYGFTAGVEGVASHFGGPAGALVFGVMGGYVDSRSTFAATQTRAGYTGGTVGGYASYLQGGFFANALVKADLLSLTYTDPTLAAFGTDSARPSVNTVGATVDLGYRVKVGATGFAEPIATLAYASSDIGAINLTSSTATFGAQDTLRGRLGLRAGGLLTDDARTRVTVSVNGSYWGRLSGESTVQINSGAASPLLNLTDKRLNGFGEVGAQVDVVGKASGWSGFVRGGYRFAGGLSGGEAQLGVRYAW